MKKISLALRTRRKKNPWPYLLVSPSLFALGIILCYPIYKLIRLSFEKYGLSEIIAGKGTFVGLQNFADTFTDPEFWKILERTIFFTGGMVFS